MAAEPTPPFSDVRTVWNTNKSNISVPSPGQVTDGWDPNEEPTSAVSNDLETKNSEWIEFLNDIGFRDWKTGVSFIVGQRRIDPNTDILYKVNTAHTSTGASLTENDLANWDVVSKNLEELLGPTWVDGEIIIGDTATTKTKKSTLIAEVNPLLTNDPGIVNGNFQHWQTNITLIAAPTGSFVADLFRYTSIGPQVHDLSRDTDVPLESDGAAAGVNFSLLLDVTTVNTGLDAGELTSFEYPMEGLHFREYFGKTFTMTFFVKSPLIGIYAVSFRNNDFSRSFVAEYEIDVANVWEKKTVTVLHDTTGTWLLNESAGMRINWTLAGGSSVQTTPGSWVNGNFLTTSSAVNIDASTSNTFRLAHISFNQGATSRNNIKDDAHELQRIARYFKVWTDIQIALSTDSNGQNWVTPIPFGVSMRAIPTIGFFNIVASSGISSPPVAEKVSKEQTSILLSSTSAADLNINSTFDVHANARL